MQSKPNYKPIENAEANFNSSKQLQKRLHSEEEQPIQYKLNINFTNLGDRRAINHQMSSFTQTSLTTMLQPGLDGDPESAFDMKFLGPSSSLQVEKVAEDQDEAKQIADALYR